MRALLCIPLFCVITVESFAQNDEVSYVPPEMGFATIGILQGGGSLVGLDIETMASERFGVQVGGGFVGFGGGLNYHLKPGGRSSFLSMQYWHQGVGDSHTQSVAGPNFVYRSRKWFTAQIGIGATLDQGPAWPDDMEQTDLILMYAIGAYFPW